MSDVDEQAVLTEKADAQREIDEVSLARIVIDKYGADTDKPSVKLAVAHLNGAHERDRLRDLLKRAIECLDDDGAARHYWADWLRRESGLS